MFRVFDIIISFFGLLFSFPILLVIFFAGLFDTGSPLFVQERVGRGKKSFKLVKFRTMSKDTVSMASHLASSSSITKLGGFLRRTKIDELPQLWNVITGDMSLVGPRPNLFNQEELIHAREALNAYNVRPGITGLAQVSGRNAISWEEKFDKDIFYVDNVSFALDCKILLSTVWKVFRRDGVSARGHATMPEFTGSNDSG